MSEKIPHSETSPTKSSDSNKENISGYPFHENRFDRGNPFPRIVDYSKHEWSHQILTTMPRIPYQVNGYSTPPAARSPTDTLLASAHKIHNGNPSSLEEMLQSITKQVASRSPTPVQVMDEGEDDTSSVSSADTLHNLVEANQQVLHISRDTLALDVDLPKGQESITDTLCKIKEAQASSNDRRQRAKHTPRGARIPFATLGNTIYT